MIQVWSEEYDETENKTHRLFAYFPTNGDAQFSAWEGDVSTVAIRERLISSTDVRPGVSPSREKAILWHDDDRGAIATYFQKRIDDIQAEYLNKIIDADLYRYIIYILKFLELMSAQLGLQKITDSIILGHESGGGLAERQALADTWSAKSGAWLNAVGKSEAAASAAKASISACNNADDMQTIVDGFPTALETALNG